MIYALLLALALGCVGAPCTAEAQPVVKVPRLGVVFPAELPSPEEPNLAAFRQALRHLGYVEGQTVALEARYAFGREERFAELIAELLQLPVDLLVVGSAHAAVAAQQATKALPIVFLGAADPVATGLVASLARPGGNLTGLSFACSAGFGGKWLEFVKAAVPEAAQVAFLQHPASGGTWLVDDLQCAAQALVVTLQPVWVREAAEIDDAFARMRAQRVDALIVGSHFFFGTHHTRVIALAAQHRVPTMYPFRHFVETGGLMSYGINIADLWRRAATYVDKILKGATPADLPVEQPLTFELVINLQTVQALGLTLPPTLLFQADAVLR